MTEAVTMAKAINVSLRDALTRDDNVLIFGEDVGALGGVFLAEALPLPGCSLRYS